MDTVLVTDSLFVSKEHERMLADAGYAVRRIDKPHASDDELIAGLRGAVGYILGGVERVSASIIKSAPTLKAIAFTGSGFDEFIPGHEEATRRGIPIAAAKGGNKEAVAEFAVALILSMVRDLPSLMPPGTATFRTTASAEDTTIGIIGLGRIGTRVAELCQALGFRVIASTWRHDTQGHESISLVPKKELLPIADVISLHVSKKHGTNVLSADDIAILKHGTIIINTAFPEATDQHCLIQRLRKGELRAAFDAPIELSTSGIGREFLIQSNMQTAFNTKAANNRISDWVVDSMIAMLNGKDHPLIVNPEYKLFRK